MSLSLVWDSEMKFHAEGGPALHLDSGSTEAYSPVQLLSHAIMGCMAMDVLAGSNQQVYANLNCR